MNEYVYINHGSEDSLDEDIYVIIPYPLNSTQECKELCETYLPKNANLITVDNGVVTWCYKGLIDECNNSIYYTYSLHKQDHANPIKILVSRRITEKIDRTIRGLLTYFSRTEHRLKIKEALRSTDTKLKLDVLNSIDLTTISNFNKKSSLEDIYKFLAFQIIQTYGLLQNPQVEIFTKSQAKDYFQEYSIDDYLNRIPICPQNLQVIYSLLLKELYEYFKGKIE